MRILQLTTHVNIGGIGRYVLNLSAALKGKGHIVFAASSGGDLEKSLCEKGVTHFYLDIKTKSELSPKIIKSFFALKKIVEEENIELIHAHTRVAAVTAALVSRATGVPYITTCHGFFKKRVGRFLCGCWGVKVIAISAAVKKHLMDDFKVPEDKIELVYTGIDAAYFAAIPTDADAAQARKDLGLQKDDFVIGAIGRLSPVKGQDILLKASTDISGAISSAKILIIGEGPSEKYLREMAASSSAGSKTVFIKNVEDTKKALSAMDVFVLPSIKEGLGLSLIEAMASGKPCVAAKVGGVKNVIEDGINGLLFEPCDAKSLSRRIIRLFNYRPLMSLLGKNAREKVLSSFDINRMADQIEKIYKGIINSVSRIRKFKKTQKKILIINVNWLGDVIFSTPFIRAIREAYPASCIVCALAPRCREILEGNPRINGLIVFDEKGREKSIIGKIRFIMRLRQERFDTVFILHRSFTRALVAFLAGIKERVGYDTKKRGILLTKKIKEPDLASADDRLHKVEYFLKLAEAAGADISKKNYEFFITDAERKKAGMLLRDVGIASGERFIVLNPGGNWNPKRWPVNYFSALGERIAEKYKVKIVISGSRKDECLAKEISDGMPHKPVSLCGKTTIREIAAVFEKAALVISGDSGPMHISVSVGAKTIALFGPTNPAITGPYGGNNYTVIQKNIGCAVPCYDVNCKDNRCMKAVLVDDVMDVIEKKGYL